MDDDGNFWFIFIFPLIHYWSVCYFQIVNAPSERKTRDESEYTEYRCEDAHEIVYREVLKQSYYMFRLFNGTFLDNLVGDNETQQVEHLKSKLIKFYSKVLTFLFYSYFIISSNLIKIIALIFSMFQHWRHAIVIY